MRDHDAAGLGPIPGRDKFSGWGFFLGFSSPVKQMSGRFWPQGLRISLSSSSSPIIIHCGRQWPKMLTRSKTTNVHKYIHTRLMTPPGIEPGSSGWKARNLSTTSQWRTNINYSTQTGITVWGVVASFMRHLRKSNCQMVVFLRIPQLTAHVAFTWQTDELWCPGLITIHLRIKLCHVYSSELG